MYSQVKNRCVWVDTISNVNPPVEFQKPDCKCTLKILNIL